MKFLPSCQQVAEQASDYIDREAPFLTRLRIGVHLAMCDACPGMIRELKAIIVGLRRLPPASLPATRRDAILREVRKTTG